MNRLADRPLDIFVDLTAGAAVHGEPMWPDTNRFTAHARRVTCAVRPNTRPNLLTVPDSLGWTLVSSSSAIASCSDAMARAAADCASFLVLHGPVEISAEALFVMRQCLDRDPMFGCVAARLGCNDGCSVRRPSQSGLTIGPWVPRRTLADGGEIEIAPEFFESALLFRPEIVGEFGPLDTRFSVLPAAILHYLSLARRCGYRTVLANRAMVTVCGLSCQSSPDKRSLMSNADLPLLQRAIPDLNRGWEESRAASNERFEELSAHAHRAAGGVERRSLLLDIRNVGPVHNGTSHAILGCLRALRDASPPWDISILAQPGAAVSVHRLHELTSGWTVTTTIPTSPLTAALRLSQPWNVQDMLDLHRAALFNAYFMLDTISWDILLQSAHRLDGTWTFLADHADGLLFDSSFTERRFLSRFTRAEKTPRAVCHYPFDGSEYLGTGPVSSEGSHILIVGNEYDHKDVTRTIDLLTTAFPFQRMVSLGPQIPETAYLRVHPSGSLPDRAVHQLYAGASLVIFPSFYEGFGFPIVTTLAYGKTLIARRSELLDEIAAYCSTGRVIAFTHRDELVSIIGRLMHREPVHEEPLGAALSEHSGRPRRWEDVAREIIEFMDRLVSQPGRARWLERERVVKQLLAFRA